MPVEIINLSHEGRGIAKIEGKTTFVLGALPNETVDIRYLKKRSKFNEAIVENVIQASPERVEPACPHFLVCGGCSLQHLESSKQIQHKQRQVHELLANAGVDVDNNQTTTIVEPLTSKPYGYRRKARLGVKYVEKKSTVMVGFRERGGRLITDMHACHVLDPRVGQLIQPLREMLYQLEGRAVIPQFEVAMGDEAVILIVRNLEPLSDADCTALRQFGDEHGIIFYLQPGKMNTIAPMDADNDATLFYQLPRYNLKLEFLPQQFTQVNAEINEKMIAQALDWLSLAPGDNVLDLFCGIGNFSLPITRTAGVSVVGVEGDVSAVKQAQHNAQLNHCDNTEFYTADLSDSIDELNWARKKYNKIILDPPRSGAKELLGFIAKQAPTHIVYVSCGPASLARDAALLQERGYKMTRFGVMDMFPQTQHVESMALFELC